MMLFRNAKNRDLKTIYRLAGASGIGLTTLPKDIELLKKRLQWSVNSFNAAVTQPLQEYYLFVLEDTNSGEIVGTSAIEASTGHETPFYSYKLSKRTRVCHSLNIRTDYEVLSLVNDNQGCSEMCTLYLDPNYRHSSNGLLLSRARFLFMAHYPARFSHRVIAEMRGISDDHGRSPFWDAVGLHFFHMSFEQADKLTISTNKQFIADLMPRNPIYVKLIAPEAQAVIGQPHQSTVPAMNILMREGFRYQNYVDIFDAGPTLEAPRDQIRSISASRVFTIKSIIDDVSSKRFMIANTKLEFRATIGHVIFNVQHNTCIISQETAQFLELKTGDCVRVLPLATDQSSYFTKANNE